MDVTDALGNLLGFRTLVVILDRAIIFVIVLTGSSAEEDVITASNYRANPYVTKLVDTGAFLQVVRSLEEFWLSVVRFPQTNDE